MFKFFFNSSSYFTCFGGEWILQECVDLFFFARVDEVCRFHLLVDDCEFAETTTPEIITTTVSHLPECTAELDGRHFPSGFDCESYYTCHDNTFNLQVCLSPLWFDRRDEVCRSPHLIWDCEFAPETQPPPWTEPPTTEITTTLRPQVECPPNGVSKHVNQYSCTRYFMCFDGFLVERSCSPGLYFSRSQLRCVRRDDSDCLLDDSVCPIDNDPNNVVFLPNQENCQKLVN